MRFVEMPAARTHEQNGCFGIKGVVLAGGLVGKTQGPANSSHEIALPVDHVVPGGGGGIFEIGHERVGAGIERVDDHLGVDRAGDLDPPVQQIGWRRRNLPIALPDRESLCREAEGFLTGVELRLALRPRPQKGEPALAEFAVQHCQEIESRDRQDGILARRFALYGNGRICTHTRLRLS